MLSQKSKETQFAVLIALMDIFAYVHVNNGGGHVLKGGKPLSIDSSFVN